MNSLYTLKNITLKYPLAGEQSVNTEVTALNNLSLDIYENEFLAILGGNGSGKSSLAKLLAGLAGNFTGEITYRGQPVTNYDRDIFSDVTMILQEPQNQILMPTVRDEIAFPLENRKLSPDQIDLKTGAIAKQFRLENLLDRKTDELSGGQITSLALATALVTDPKVIILDEPDSHLDSDSRQILTDFTTSRKNNLTVILISQYLESIKGADRCLILGEGKSYFCGVPHELFANREVLENSGLFPQTRRSVKENIIERSEANRNKINPNLALKDVSFSYDKANPVLADINLEIFPGEIIGLYGPSGSGKTTLGFLMAGLYKPDKGMILLNGNSLDKMTPKQIRSQIAISMQFPERALIGHTVAEDIAFGPQNLNLNDIDSRVESNLRQFKLEYLRSRHPFTLSGGQKRRSALAGVIALDSAIIILDEPTAGLDPQSTADFIGWIAGNRNHTFIMISHDCGLLDSICDRQIKLIAGKIGEPVVSL
jgi:energy-coupling factor transporter ATP-binding protein EcfA2